MIGVADLARAGLDEAFKAQLLVLLQVMQSGAPANMDDAADRFAAGYDKLLRCYQRALAVVDSRGAA